MNSSTRREIPAGRAGVRETLRVMRGLINAGISERSILDIVGNIQRRVLSPETDHDVSRRENALSIGIADFVREHVRYVPDPVNEERVSLASETIRRGYGDCDDIAVVIGTLGAAVGFRVNLVAHGPGKVPIHVYAELIGRSGSWPIDPIRKDYIGRTEGHTAMTQTIDGLGALGENYKKYARKVANDVRDQVRSETRKRDKTLQTMIEKLRKEWSNEKVKTKGDLRRLATKYTTLKSLMEKIGSRSAADATRISSQIGALRGEARALASRLAESTRRLEGYATILNDGLKDSQKRIAILEQAQRGTGSGDQQENLRYMTDMYALLAAMQRGETPQQAQPQQSATPGYESPESQLPGDSYEEYEFTM